MKAPRCEQKGTVPHDANLALTWDLPSGRQTKYFCEEHSKYASSQPHYIWKLIGYFERNKGVLEED
jgi:hypothetical protein